MLLLGDNGLKFSCAAGNKGGRSSNLPLVVGLALALVQIAVTLALSFLLFAQNAVFALLLAASALAFLFIVLTVAMRMLSNGQRLYNFEITPTELILEILSLPPESSARDKKKKQSLHKRSERRKIGRVMVYLPDVRYCEYYPYPDSASMIFHTAYSHLEVPLWPLGERRNDLVDYLIGLGIEVVNVQFDDEIPSLN
jgi:ABC-type multidrug transport system fused ATPase/permease subunit